MWIAVIFLICLCIVLIYNLAQKKQVDKTIEEKNNQLAQINSQLFQEQKSLQHSIQQLKDTNNSILSDINQHQSLLNNIINQNQEISEKAFREYCEVLETKYVDFEREIDEEARVLIEKIAETREELNKIKATRAAAHQALLKEQEIKDNKDNYRLLPSEGDLADSRRLEIVKRELNKPRILCMLIWQTYWQPLAKKQFPLILQDKTKCGIYKITNQITDECYVGQSVDIYKRWCDHCKCGLGIDTPPGNKLYKAMQEYGLNNFTFELIEECSQSELNEKENYFIEMYQADIFGYNGNIGVK